MVCALLSKSPADRPNAQTAASQLDEIVALLREPRSDTRETRSLGPGAWLAAALALVVAAAAWLASGKREVAELADVTMKPLTSQAGWEMAPALTADGGTIAFTWSARLDGPRQIYVKREKDAEPRQLTNSTAAGQIGYLVWSPDARRIAFKRRFLEGGGAIY